MESKNQPLVSIGVPVFNGEAGLALALDSLLGQDYFNLEIVISDNGSTDTTSEICRQYCQKDKRIKYYRSEENRGVIWNFERVFQLSAGKYFMWASHDDRREAAFISASVKKMEQRPNAALCQAHTGMFVEGRKELLCVASLNSFEGIKGLVERYRETLKRFPATALYGLYRSQAMRKTKLYQKAIATDLAFIQELSIYGDFIQVPEILFNYFGRKNWNTIDQDYRVFFGKEKKPFWYIPFIVLFLSHWKRVIGASIPLFIKFRLCGELIKYETVQVLIKIFIKISGLLCPKRWKEKLGRAIYFRFIHSPNVEVRCDDLFLERVIKPKLGWWR